MLHRGGIFWRWARLFFPVLSGCAFCRLERVFFAVGQVVFFGVLADNRRFAFIVGIVWQKDWLLYCVGGAAFLMLITERNFYRAYMEKHLYDGSGDSRIDFDDLYGG